ncbi:hypothetical protein [Neobacillus mesonae]|uniref:hypothetical protein n=1 Tax=Neobacillus mesonae TaxID=1193713 RepID=UPI002041F5A3|nr:hypothetical protein [Neobacillus mesonae]MCM3567263.1 hypothetical protein [Neobacillus mesonae]
MMIASILIGILLVASLVYTFRAGRAVDVRNSEVDKEISGTIKKNWVSLNPIFLAYIIGIGAMLLYIVYHIVR